MPDARSFVVSSLRIRANFEFVRESFFLELYVKYGTALRSGSDEEAPDGGFGGVDGMSDGGGGSLGSGGGSGRRKPTLQRLRKVSSVMIRCTFVALVSFYSHISCFCKWKVEKDPTDLSYANGYAFATADSLV